MCWKNWWYNFLMALHSLLDTYNVSFFTKTLYEKINLPVLWKIVMAQQSEDINIFKNNSNACISFINCCLNLANNDDISFFVCGSRVMLVRYVCIGQSAFDVTLSFLELLVFGKYYITSLLINSISCTFVLVDFSVVSLREWRRKEQTVWT